MDEHVVTLRPPVWALLLAVAVGGLFFVAGKRIEADREPQQSEPTISVTGEGKVSAVPDIALVSLGVRTKRTDSADAAMTLLEKDMNAVIAAVKKEGVEEKDITTEHLSLNPIYDWTENGQVFRGFEASQSLRVKVRKLEDAGDVVSAATRAGANSAGGIQFTLDDPEKVRNEAREKAITQAKEKAKILASQLGVGLGELQSFTEGGGGYYPPMPYARMDAAMGAGEEKAMESIAIPAGEQEIIVQVTMTYEID